MTIYSMFLKFNVSETTLTHRQQKEYYQAQNDDQERSREQSGTKKIVLLDKYLILKSVQYFNLNQEICSISVLR